MTAKKKAKKKEKKNTEPPQAQFWSEIRDICMRKDYRGLWTWENWRGGHSVSASTKLTAQYVARVIKGERWPSFKNMVNIAGEYGFELKLVKKKGA